MGVMVSFIAIALIAAGAAGTAFFCSLPDACNIEGGLRFLSRAEVVLAAGLTLLGLGFSAYAWTRRSTRSRSR